MVCFPDNRPGEVGGAAHRMRPCGQAHRDFRRRTWYAFLTTGPAELAAPHIDCVPASRPFGPIVGEACNAVPEKSEGPVGRDAKDLRPANTAGPAVGEASDARVRKDRRASLQGRKRLACRKHRRACCRGSKRCPCPKRPKGQFAGTQTTCVPQTPQGLLGLGLGFGLAVCAAEMRLGCKNALNLLIGVSAANGQRIGVLAANWR